MKKMKVHATYLLVAGLIGGCLTFSGCGGKKTVTMDEIASASLTDNLLKNHTSFQYTATWAEDNFTFYPYVDKEMFYVTYPDFAELYLDEILRYYSRDDDLSGVLYIHQEPHTYYMKDSVIFLKDDTQSIKSCEEKDGKLYVYTELTAEGTKAKIEADAGTYIEGEYMALDYVLDAKTKEIFSAKGVLIAEDGTKRDYVIESVEYDVSRPEIAQTMYEHATATENLRTVTIITDPDTKEEQSFTTQVPKKDGVQLYHAEEYQTLFLDRACTKPSTSVDRDADSTVGYMAKGK